MEDPPCGSHNGPTHMTRVLLVIRKERSSARVRSSFPRGRILPIQARPRPGHILRSNIVSMNVTRRKTFPPPVPHVFGYTFIFFLKRMTYSLFSNKSKNPLCILRLTGTLSTQFSVGPRQTRKCPSWKHRVFHGFCRTPIRQESFLPGPDSTPSTGMCLRDLFTLSIHPRGPTKPTRSLSPP